MIELSYFELYLYGLGFFFFISINAATNIAASHKLFPMFDAVLNEGKQKKYGLIKLLLYPVLIPYNLVTKFPAAARNITNAKNT